MSKADTDHKNGDGLMSGLGIANGIPNSNPRLEPTPTLGGGGTLTGLALRDDGTKVLVTCQHVMAGYTLENVGGVGVRAYTTARGTERMYHPTMANAHQVSASLVAVPLSSSDPNKVDLATVGMAASVNASYRLHDPNHSGTGREGSGAHAARRIVSGTVDPAVLMRENKKVTLIGAKTGEGTAYIKGVNLGYGDDYGDQVWVYRRRFVGVMKIFMPDGMTFINGDSGSPVLMEVQNGVYKMVGIIFAIDGRDNTILAFPASAAQTAAGITFGEPLPPVPSLNEMDSFDDYAYGTWRALTDFDDVEHRLHNVDLYNSRVRWLGSSVPGTGPNYHWWSVGVPSGNENPTSVRFSVRGSPEIDEDFAQGRRWGFKVYVRHQGATAWTHAFSGEDVLSATGYTSGEDDNPIVVAGFEVPITNSADAVREYFQPYRNGEFEVKIEGAPIDPDVDLLGTLPEGDTTRSGSWSSDIASVHRSGRYARFYVFRLDRRGTLRLSLTSSVDTYMFLLDGAGKNGDLVERNDDRDYPDNLNSLITRTLDAGDYTIEATTFYEGTMGDFELGARLMSNDATLSGLDLSAGELIPAFTAGETSYTASVEHTQNTITVTPTANHASATITVNGVATTSGTESVALSLLAGDNTINVEVTAEDGTQRTYSIRVTRAASSTQGTPTQAPPPPPPPPDDDNDDDDDDCTEWVETGVNRGQCDDWEMQETRTCTNSEGESVPQTRWVSWEGPAETWGSWSSWAETSEHRGACDDWEIKETRTRTSNRCRTETQYQWVSWEGPAETWGSWSSWAETSETRGQCDDWEIKETRTRTSNRCRTQTQERWVTWEGPAETWGSWSSWSDTGSHRGSGMEREKEQERTRTSNRCRTQTEERWVADPESTPTPPVTETWGDWGAWTDTGTTRGTDEYREKEQSRTRTSNRNNTQTQTRWVSDE